MSIKKKVAMGMGSIAMGAMAVMGGTFAYFSDEVEAQSKFTNGTLNLQPEKASMQSFNITNWKPGDKLEAKVSNEEPAMILNNQGTLPMDVFLDVDVTVTDNYRHENPETLGESADNIFVTHLALGGQDLLADLLVGDTDGKLSLKELSDRTDNLSTELNNNTINDIGKYIGFLDAPDAVSTTEKSIKGLTYVIEFPDSGQPQNTLQGEEITIDFTFTGLQYEGETFSKANNNINNSGAGGGGEYSRTDGINDNQSGDNKQ